MIITVAVSAALGLFTATAICVLATRSRVDLENQLLVVLYLHPLGLQPVELAEKVGHPLHRVRHALARLNEQGRAMPLEIEPGVRVWMGILPEDGDR